MLRGERFDGALPSELMFEINDRVLEAVHRNATSAAAAHGAFRQTRPTPLNSELSLGANARTFPECVLPLKDAETVEVGGL
jgi:hypothetical protein